MELKDLPLSIQVIAANALSESLEEINLASAKKDAIDNMTRNVRDAFIGLYSGAVTDNHDAEDVAKKIAETAAHDTNTKNQKQLTDHETNELLLAMGSINFSEYDRREKMLSDQPIKISF
ncbi:hypothetical protein JOU96_001929 [Salmonella enterica]|nr:hypothetical protein [Salmonella enterica]EDX5727859.1 hypothetical protein [Salmonella enterica subsp. enterica serovar Sandiego]EAV6213383.1 hypothetical protein [Salmonella enterica]EBI9053743.1 hypothetical protein [Salmonella enterica]EDC2355077.1 hypothetical protein [Salmonella enterica]